MLPPQQIIIAIDRAVAVVVAQQVRREQLGEAIDMIADLVNSQPELQLLRDSLQSSERGIVR